MLFLDVQEAVLSMEAAGCVVHNFSHDNFMVVSKARFYSLTPICSVIDFFFFFFFNLKWLNEDVFAI